MNPFDNYFRTAFLVDDDPAGPAGAGFAVIKSLNKTSVSTMTPIMTAPSPCLVSNTAAVVQTFALTDSDLS